MLVLVVLIVLAVIAILAVASLGVGRGRGRRRVARPRRARRVDPRRGTDERSLLAEGEAIQRRVEADLSARGVASHRLSGPNPPSAAERLAPPGPPDDRALGGRRRIGRRWSRRSFPD